MWHTKTFQTITLWQQFVENRCPHTYGHIIKCSLHCTPYSVCTFPPPSISSHYKRHCVYLQKVFFFKRTGYEQDRMVLRHVIIIWLGTVLSAVAIVTLKSISRGLFFAWKPTAISVWRFFVILALIFNNPAYLRMRDFFRILSIWLLRAALKQCSAVQWCLWQFVRSETDVHKTPLTPIVLWASAPPLHCCRTTIAQHLKSRSRPSF